MFTQEQLSTSTDAKEMIRGIEEEAWLECARHGRIERVQCFAADAACPVVLRFEASSAAAACVDSMSGRYYDERRLEASLYDGHRKRVMPDDVDIERSVRLGAVVAERRAEQEREAAAVAAAAEAEKERVAAEAAAEALAAGEAAAAEAAAAAARVRLPRHTYVKLVGLVSKPEKNGAVGVVEGVDEGSGRYTVKLREGGALALKLANLLQMAEVRLVGNLGPSRGISGNLGPSRGISGSLGGSRGISRWEACRKETQIQSWFLLPGEARRPRGVDGRARGRHWDHLRAERRGGDVRRRAGERAEPAGGVRQRAACGRRPRHRRRAAGRRAVQRARRAGARV